MLSFALKLHFVAKAASQSESEEELQMQLKSCDNEKSIEQRKCKREEMLSQWKMFWDVEWASSSVQSIIAQKGGDDEKKKMF